MHGLGGPRPRFSWNSRHTKLAAGATAAAVVSAGAYHQRKSSLKAQQQAPSSTHALALPTPSIRLPASLVEAIAGAIGEVVQVAILYPLDTIKVRCQANGMMSTEVVKDLVARSASRPATLVSSLYAGVGGATLCSIIIGAVHFSSYETSKRCMFERLPELLTPLQQVLPAVAAPLTSGKGHSISSGGGSSSSSSGNEQGSASGSGRSSAQQQQQLEQQQQQDRQRSHAGASSSNSSSSSSSGVSNSGNHAVQSQASSSGGDSIDSSSSMGSTDRKARRSRRGHSRAESDGSQGSCHHNSSQQQQQQQDHTAACTSTAASASNTNQQPSQPPTTQGSHPPPHAPGQASHEHQQGIAAEQHTPPEQTHDNHPQPHLNLHLMDEYPSFKAADKLGVNLVASVITAIATALVESPVELFRHNQQVGTVEGNFMKEMLSTVRRKGPMGLYWGFLPHCFEALPHDISEMLVMGCMKDMHIDAMTLNTKPHHRFIRSIPVEAWDLTAGAASGVAAVLVSMPFDCIKTYMQTRGTNVSGQGVLGTANIFLHTGKDMVARKGPGCLYYGVVPRLLQQVPSSMMCWWAVHAVMRALQPWTIKEEKADEEGGGSK